VADTDTAMVSSDTSTDLVVNDNDNSDSDIDEQKSGFAAAMGNVDVLRQLTLIMA
jgi:flagellar M-ring protein FliF